MSAPQTLEPLSIQSCVADLRIRTLSEWDVLVFLLRRSTSLVSASQIARLLGYNPGTVADALERLESLELIERSREARGVRLYRPAISSFPFIQSRSRGKRDPQRLLEQLVALAETRDGRLQVIETLGSIRRKRTHPNETLHFA